MRAWGLSGSIMCTVNYYPVEYMSHTSCLLPPHLLWPTLYIVTIIIIVTINMQYIVTITIYCDHPYYCDQYCSHQLSAGEGSTAETRGLAGNLAPATQPQLQLHSCSLVTLSAGLTSAQHTLSSSFSSSTLVKCAVIRCICTCGALLLESEQPSTYTSHYCAMQLHF